MSVFHASTNVNYWCRKSNVSHAVTTNFVARNFNTTALTNDSLKTNSLVLSTCTFPSLLRSKNLFAEKTILLRAQCAVVDCLRLLNFS